MPVRHKSKFQREHNPFEPTQVYLPKATAEILRERAEKLVLPISRLISIAVDNELDSPAPFTYLCQIPTNTFIELAYIEEAQKIARYLIKFPSGTGRDQLMLCRRDIGIENRETFMLAYRELLNANVIEEIDPPLRTKFEYAKGYKYTRLKNAPVRKATRFKQKRIADLQTELDQEKEMLKKYGVDENGVK